LSKKAKEMSDDKDAQMDENALPRVKDDRDIPIKSSAVYSYDEQKGIS